METEYDDIWEEVKEYLGKHFLEADFNDNVLNLIIEVLSENYNITKK